MKNTIKPETKCFKHLKVFTPINLKNFHYPKRKLLKLIAIFYFILSSLTKMLILHKLYFKLLKCLI